MPKNFTNGFKDPVRRPRYIIWTGVVVLVLAAFVVVAFGATSTYWFCASVCHKVQDDSIEAYNRSSHSEVSCMSCHEPANADPVTFTLKKAKALGELVMTVTNNYKLPLNAADEVALNRDEMNSGQCTQCHSANRVITPSDGIIIDHAVHEKNDIQCTACHNRVAHNETGSWEPSLTDPQTNATSVKHANFMSMTACFRCHTLTDEAPEGGMKAPGTCSTCHSADFKLKPSSHDDASFTRAGHGALAMTPIDRSTGKPATTEAAKTAAKQAIADEKEAAAEGGSKADVLELVSVDQLNYCATCHKVDTFCTGCHGMEMPHSTEFKTTTHGKISETKMDKCDLCHQVKKNNYEFCNDCHHGTQIDWKYDTKVDWKLQHGKAVTEKGVDACLGACHEKKFCIDCHAKTNPIPASHKAKDWLHNKLTVTKYGTSAAAPTAAHAVNALKNVDSCEICHGTGGINAKFCKDCHGMEMPHPDSFKKNHVSSASSKAKCSTCHQFKEVCSDCHHAGAKNGVAWQKQHSKVVDANGAADCFKCHEDKKFCVDCHTKLKAVPDSHKAANWLHSAGSGKSAGHSAAFTKANDSCEYCHGTGGTKAKFCSDCHKLIMPHPSDFKDTHKSGFASKKYTKATCENCHNQYYCDSCHHVGASSKVPWRQYHPTIVKKNGTEACFKCHEPTYCSYCHVRLIR